MDITAYRLVPRKHADTAFTGTGARLYGGRWNSPGTAVVYTSESLALCCLEIFVHLPSYKLLQGYVYIKVHFDSALVLEAELPDGWNARPISGSSQAIGNRWVSDGRFPVLKVPSVIIPEGVNYLLNVAHPDVHHIKQEPAADMTFDPRLQKG
ncbi:MAG: hypothetical protein CSA20_04440 [Deltaproteobacteria bacterium]|nr:MAG: hypothetical protein CSA20_04440 [Deltaproteobacteria bacterium]